MEKGRGQRPAINGQHLTQGKRPLALGRPSEQKKDMIKEHDRVVLTKAVAEGGLEAGDVGTVVHLYADGKAYEVEFVALDGHTVAVATVEASDVRPVTASEIPHARELARREQVVQLIIRGG